jgi:hypothetical protein
MVLFLTLLIEIFSHAGGGGEKVLWCMIDALKREFNDKIEIAIYTGISSWKHLLNS